MINASACFSSIVVANIVCIGLVPQELQLQDRFDVVLWPVSQVIPAEHVPIEGRQVSCFDNALDAPKRIEIVRLLLLVQLKYRYDMPSRNNQGMPGIDRIGIEDSKERPVLEDKGVGFAA